MHQPIGFIGVGHMGFPMARNLLRAGYSLRVYDLDPARADALVALGATRVAGPGEAVEPGGVVVSMVPHDQALLEIVTGSGGILARIGAGGVHVSCSTISVPLTRRVAALYTAQGSHYLAATVSGRPDVAAAAQLSIFSAGPSVARARVLPLLSVLGNPERLYDLGEQQEAAAAVKLAFNYPIALAILAMAGASALVEKYGVPRATFLHMLQASPLFAGKVYQGYGDMIAADQYERLFPVALGLKDIELILETAALVDMGLPVADLYRDYLLQAVERGWAEEDWAVVARVIAHEAGLPVVCAGGQARGTAS
jgi:3-hydroxyisobutyrate dehydrogenase-like beta-hydroxyacid dehydrogenase